MLDQISHYDRNHRELGCTYYFPELGLSLWREYAFQEKDVYEDWFMEQSLEQQEDILRKLYFQAVSVETEEVQLMRKKS